MNIISLPRFDDPKLSRDLLAQITRLSVKTGPVKIMEVCGTHTMEIGRLGLRSLLPPKVQLLSGPGCPVCVTPGSVIDALVHLASKGLHVLTYGDMVRVPGAKGSLESERARGGKVTTVLSPLDSIKLAQERPAENFVFAAVGFETTAPGTALAVLEARKSGLGNLSFLVCHRVLPPGLLALADDRELALSGFMLPGHVSIILGTEPYGFLVDKRLPAVITGFEPVDILFGIRRMLELISEGKYEVVNAYPRAVKPEGNPLARQRMEQVFITCDAEWRGIGTIPRSGLSLRPDFDDLNAENRHDLRIAQSQMPKGCSCGEVLKGKLKPNQCPLFGKRCTPESPMGPCMVSSEGSCAAYYKYE